MNIHPRTIAHLLAAMLISPHLYAAPPQVQVEQGVVEGSTSGAVSAFLGLPFAAPPLGDLRWRPPLPPARWSGVRKADRFNTSCAQESVPTDRGLGPWTAEYWVSGPVGEDCLYLNVWTPAKKAANRFPVLFWIHGGGFNQGSGSVPIYDGASLAARGVVVISVNYRLGVYGFFAHPLLSSEAGPEGTGEFGLRDQIAALRWVQKNVAAFGGDPGRITIAGQSAGAASVHNLILSPLAKGLFQRAIAQSGSGMGIPLPSSSDAEQTAVRFMQAAGVKSISDLRSLSTAQLSAALRKFSQGDPFGGMRFVPYADGIVVPADPEVAARSGRYNDTPVLTGLTNDEGSTLSPDYRIPDPAGFQQALEKRYGKDWPAFSALYPANRAEISGPQLSRDRGIAAMLLWVEQRNQTGHFPVYCYLYTHPEPGTDAARYGVFHSSEIPYVFGTLDKTPDRPFTAEDHAIGATMGRYWVNFVATGDPNSDGLATWPKCDREEQIMELGQRFGARAALTREQSDLFHNYVRRGGKLSLF
jgi:para-nitrobenzyl esterase